MLARPAKPFQLNHTTSNSFSQPMYVHAVKHQYKVQQIERSRQLILRTSDSSKGLKSITVKYDVLTFVYADTLDGDEALTSTKFNKHIKDFTYGLRHDKDHDLWHFGEMNFDEPHVHIIKTNFNPKNFTKLITPKQFSGIVNDLTAAHPDYLKKIDANNLTTDYQRFYFKNTRFSCATGFGLFSSMKTHKVKKPTVIDPQEKVVEIRHVC